MSSRNVFINCPFTSDYQDFFNAIVFTIVRSGFEPRCAREEDNGVDIRINKIVEIIRDCPFSIHDISMTELDAKTQLPRFNMPFELGLFIGAVKFGGAVQKKKKCLILDTEKYRFNKFLSDISGQDIHAHNKNVDTLIVKVATWLRDNTDEKRVPGGKAIAQQYLKFKQDVPLICETKHLDKDEVTFKDFHLMAAEWIAAQ